MNSNLIKWKTYNKDSCSCNLLDLPLEEICKVLWCRLYDIRTCYGRGCGYQKYYLKDKYGEFKNIYEIPSYYIERVFRYYKDQYFISKDKTYE